MLDNKFGDSIFILPILDRYLLYAPLHGLTVILNKKAALMIKEGLYSNMALLNNNGLSEILSILSSPTLQNPNRTGEVKPDFLGIIASRRCNMACNYCDFGALKNKIEQIDPKAVVSAIDYFADLCIQHNRRYLPIQFFGGEPFIEQEIIEIAIHHARFISSKLGLIPHFEVLTNGYFGEATRTFIKDYFDRVVISFDGYKKYHDRTRPLNQKKSSYNKIAENIKILSKTNVELAIRCCITSESVGDMVEMSKWFCCEFEPDIVNFETLTQNSRTIKANLFSPDPYLFAINSIKSWHVLRENGVIAAYAPVSINRTQTTSCPVGRDVLIVHPDGMIASCYLPHSEWEEKQLDLSVGHINLAGRVDINVRKIKKLRNLVYTKKRCESCFCRFGCSGNCHVNTTYPGSNDKYTDFCVHTRIITICEILEEMEQNVLISQIIGNENELVKIANNENDNYYSLN